MCTKNTTLRGEENTALIECFDCNLTYYCLALVFVQDHCYDNVIEFINRKPSVYNIITINFLNLIYLITWHRCDLPTIQIYSGKKVCSLCAHTMGTSLKEFL